MAQRRYVQIAAILATLVTCGFALADGEPCSGVNLTADPNNPPTAEAVFLSSAVTVGRGTPEPVVQEQQAMPAPGQRWTATATQTNGQATSTYVVSTFGSQTIATLTLDVSSSDETLTGEASGENYLQVYVSRGAGAPQTSTILVQTYQMLTASEGASGYAKFDGVDQLSNPYWTNVQETTYQVDFGNGDGVWLPATFALDSSVQLVGSGQIATHTQVIITNEGCDSTPPQPPEDDTDNSNDDEDGSDPNSPCDGSTDAGDGLHVHLMTGNVWTRVPILRTFAYNDVELDFELRYDSQRAGEDGPAGYGWTHSYNLWMETVTGGAIFHDGQGRRNFYSYSGGLYLVPMGRDAKLTQEGSGSDQHFVLTWPSGTRAIFNPPSNGISRISQLVDRRGRTTSFTYTDGKVTGILSPHGRAVTITYVSGTNRIYTITDPDNKTTTLAYDGGGNLVSVTDPLTPPHAQGFVYDTSHRMTQETLKNNVYYTAVYASNYRVLKDMGGHEILRITSPSGFPATRSDTMANAWLSHIDGRGQSWSIHRDNLGRLRQEIDPTQTYSRTYEYGGPTSGVNRNRLIKITNQRGDYRTFSYNSDGHLVQRQDEAGDLETFTYTSDPALPPGTLTQRTEPDNDSWTYTYYTQTQNGHVVGDLWYVTDPLNDGSMTYAYSTYGDTEGLPSGTPARPGRIKQVSVTDRNGHETDYDYSPFGNVTRITRDPGTGHLNLVTDYEYDGMGRPVWKKVYGGAGTGIKIWTWDDMGRLLGVTQDMDGNPQQDPNDLVTTYAYDAYGNLTDTTNPRNVTTHYGYDDRNRLVNMTKDVGGLNLYTEWTLDGNGNVLDDNEPNGGTTSYVYNERNALTQITDAEGYVTFLTPDPVGMVTLMQRSKSVGGNGPFYVEAYMYDKINRLLTKTVDPGTMPAHLNLVTTYAYTAMPGCGCSPATPGVAKPYKIIDPKGKYTYFQYDKLDRLTKVIRKVGDTSPDPDADDAVTSYELDPMGNLLAVVEPEGERVEFEYDNADRRHIGRAKAAPDPDFEFMYDYDGASNLTQLTRPDGHVLTMTYDLANRLKRIQDRDENNLIQTIGRLVYDKNGNVTNRITGGFAWQFGYDHLDRVTTVKDPIIEPNDAYSHIAYDDANCTQGITDRSGVVTHKQFDKLGRLTALIENYGGTDATANTETDFGYDGVRQTSITDHDLNTTTYGYDAALRLASVAYPDAGTVSFEHDAAGNISSRTDQRGIHTTYTYNDLYQMVTRSYTGGAANRDEHFSYDLSGRLTWASNVAAGEGVELDFTYDPIGRLKTTTQSHEDAYYPTSYQVGYSYVVDPCDPLSRTVAYPSGRQVMATLDRRSRLQSVLDAANNGASWTFDNANRRESAMMGNGVQSFFEYDADSRLTRVSHYNDVNLDPFYDVQLGYDSMGNRLWKRDNVQTDRSETYGYDQRERLTGFDRGIMDPDPNNPVIVTDCNDPQLPNRQDWLNLDRRGNWLSFESQVQSVTGSQARTLASSPAEPENPLGGKMNEYGRINMQVGTKQAGEKFTYDEAGNLIAVDSMGDMNCDGVTDNGDINAFILALTDPATYVTTYPNCAIELGDINGDGTVGIGDINPFVAVVNNGLVQAQRYEYDEENRLTRIATINDATVLELRYDALGRRVEALDYTEPNDPCADANGGVRTQHVYSGLETIEEHVLCGTPPAWALVREFIWGADHTEPLALINWTSPTTWEVFHYVRDALGSVAALTDAGNPQAQPPMPPAVVERYEYDAYGRTYIENADGSQRFSASQYGNPFTWTGQRYDAGVKLYAFPARTYSPELGRWFQRDPLGFVDGVNMYEYVRSMPTKLTDPLGLMWLLCPGYPNCGGGGTGGDGGGDPPPPPDGGDGPQPGGCGGGGGPGEGGPGEGGSGGGAGGGGSGPGGPPWLPGVLRGLLDGLPQGPACGPGCQWLRQKIQELIDEMEKGNEGQEIAEEAFRRWYQVRLQQLQMAQENARRDGLRWWDWRPDRWVLTGDGYASDDDYDDSVRTFAEEAPLRGGYLGFGVGLSRKRLDAEVGIGWTVDDGWFLWGIAVADLFGPLSGGAFGSIGEAGRHAGPIGVLSGRVEGGEDEGAGLHGVAGRTGGENFYGVGTDGFRGRFGVSAGVYIDPERLPP